MKILLDQNLSFKLCSKLKDIFPDIIHIKDVSLEAASYEEVWLYAKLNSFILISKDSDFIEKAVIKGHPPKIIWIKTGNCPTDQIEMLVRKNRKIIEEFIADKENSVLTIS
jgi:predicted nuclease of predicted toxin-antitoxin system